ncbi:MAG: cytochrome c oxidase assembly protein [Anaeromyxobacteraceae bacterium]
MRRLLSLAVLLPAVTLAHEGEVHAAAARTSSAVEGLALAVLAAAGLLYLAGLRARWRARTAGHTALALEGLAYGAGLVALAAALAPPLDRAAAAGFAAHMAQHQLLLLVAPPLLVLGRPHLAALAALRPGPRLRLAALLRRPAVRGPWRVLASAPGAAALHAGALWLWHAPEAWGLALAHPWLHGVQHLTFFATALLFWWAMILGRFGRAGYGAAVVYVFATAVHTGALGALLTFARAPWYPDNAGARDAAATLADQQLGGLVMWIPSGLYLTLLGLALLAAWLGDLERRASRAPLALLLAAVLGTAAGCTGTGRAQDEARRLTGGDPERGRAALRGRGCVACHTVPGVPGAGKVGPSLQGLATRSYLAGRLPNTPGNLVRWIRTPREVDPRTAMPDLGVGEAEARDIAAYLYSLRE